MRLFEIIGAIYLIGVALCAVWFGLRYLGRRRK